MLETCDDLRDIIESVVKDELYLRPNRSRPELARAVADEILSRLYGTNTHVRQPCDDADYH